MMGNNLPTCIRQKESSKSQSQENIFSSSPVVEGKEIQQDLSYNLRSKLQILLEQGQELRDFKKFQKLSKQAYTVLKEEFYLLNDITSTPEHDKNLIKIMEGNRYCDIFPYKHTQIKQDFHINANNIRSAFNKQNIIAAQGPTNPSLYSFLKTLFVQKVTLVAMLCYSDSQGRVCAEYFPQYMNEKKQIEDIQIQVKQILNVDLNESNSHKDILIRKISITYQNQEHEFMHYQYQTWPDNSVPKEEHTRILFEILDAIYLEQQKESGKILVHCSAGIGRTGTLIALSNIYGTLKYYKENQIEKSQQKISIFGTVRRLREQRKWVVQTSEQYIYLYYILYRLQKHVFKMKENNVQQ